MEPLISVIIPVYNVEKYLRKCLDSVVNQTYKNLEIILVDDGSLDCSGKICDEYAKKDPRVVVIHKENARQGAARNSGLNVAKGEYIAFIDSDDFIEEDMYETMLSEMKKNDADISVCGIYNVGPLKTILSSTCDNIIIMNNAEMTKAYYTTHLIHCSICNKLYHKKLWEHKRFREDIYREDEYIFYDILADAEKLVHIGKPKYYYIIREGSTERGGFRPEFTIINESVDKQYESVKTKYPEIKEIVWDMRIRNRIGILNEMIYSNSVRKHKDIFDNTINFLKENTPYDAELKKTTRYIITHQKLYTFSLSLNIRLKSFLKRLYRRIKL